VKGEAMPEGTVAVNRTWIHHH